MKELKKPKKKKLVFENVCITSLSENGTYVDFYARGTYTQDGSSRTYDSYSRGTETDLFDEILF